MAPDPNHPGEPSRLLTEAIDATRRTHLASERTQLAWWRTGLAALAVGIGVGRVIPELDPSATRWPYAVTGVGFVIWGISAIAYGSARRSAIERALAEGRFSVPAPGPLRALTGGGIALGVLTALLILLD